MLRTNVPRLWLGLLLGVGSIAAIDPAQAGPACDRKCEVPGSDFLPQYAPGGSTKPVRVHAFSLDRWPVTESDYSAFVRTHAAWAPKKPALLFAEEKYLSHWKKTGARYEPPRDKRKHPVVFVSYFAAAAYCEWKGGRLPTTVEWEYAASEDPKLQLEWFANPSPPREVGKGPANKYGIQDLHGQVWEWTMDYNSSFASADNREDGQMDKNFFCGSGSMNARDRENYPAFMRYALRAALHPNFVMANLGFRCAYDAK